MKLNNKGFVISTLMYALLIVFLFLLIGIITLLSNRKSILDRLKKDVKNEINGMVKNDYYPNGTVIYYNPVTNKVCNDYDEDNSLNENKTGCLKWYTFNDSVNSNKVNMILDHNTTQTVVYNSENTNTSPKEVQEELDNLIYGSKWKSKPRLITAEEVVKITNIENFSSEGSTTYYMFDGDYSWLYDYTSGCESYGCNHDIGTAITVYGYWTSSIRGDKYVWRVNRSGGIYGDINANHGSVGVRPVITVGKKIIYKQYKEAKLNGADPVLKKDMIPVTINNNGTVTKADIKEEWYKYTDKKWANAVVLVDNTSYNAGDTIPEAKIKAYYVWIPRYKYKLFDNTTESTIDIVFENKNTTKSESTTVGQYLTHPAFTYGTEELSGFWVGKFETTGTVSSPTIKPYMSDNSNSTIISLRSMRFSTQYKTSVTVSSNSTMMKNDEWGAVAYLTNSIYGLNGKVRINNNKNYKTGCGASDEDKENTSSVTSCQIEYGKATDYPQGTTGNISGIFDMAGGAWEYMMAVRADSEGKPLSGKHNIYNSGFNGKFGCPNCTFDSGVDPSIIELTTGIDYPDAKKYNLYDNPSNRNNIDELNGCNGNPCYGHALNETRITTDNTGAWYGEMFWFIKTTFPFVKRGCNNNCGTRAGVFASMYASGYDSTDSSFRVVVR